MLQQLHYGFDVRPPAAAIEQASVAPHEGDLGRRLVDEVCAEACDPAADRDETRERARARIENKAKKEEVAVEPGMPPRGKVIDLTAELRAGLDQSRGSAGAWRPSAHRRSRAGGAKRRGGSRRSSAARTKPSSRPDRTSGER